MERSRKVRHGRSRSPLYLAMIIALSGASAATAADTSTAFADELAKLKHVRVVNAPQLATPAPMSAQTGLMAYKDPETGALRGPTQEELNQAAAASRFTALQAFVPVEFAAQDGAIGMYLGDSQMVYTVVRKLNNGELAEFCVVGEEEASKVLNLKAPALSASTKKVIRYER